VADVQWSGAGSDPAQASGVRATPWNVGDIVKAVVLAVVFIVLAVISVLAAGLALRFAGIQLGDSRVLLVVVLVLVQNIGLLLGVWAFGLRKHGAGLDRLGLRPYLAKMGCAYAAFALLLSFGFNVFYTVVVTGGLGREVTTTPVLPLFGGGLLGFGVALAIASGIVPFAEEIFFRGFLFPGLARRFGFAAGALLSAVVFGAAHLSGDSFIPLSFFGLVLALLYGATGSIFPGIMMHSINNSIALLAAFLVESGVLR